MTFLQRRDVQLGVRTISSYSIRHSGLLVRFQIRSSDFCDVDTSHCHLPLLRSASIVLFFFKKYKINHQNLCEIINSTQPALLSVTSKVGATINQAGSIRIIIMDLCDFQFNGAVLTFQTIAFLGASLQ